MRIAAQRGALIVFEGCDRSGKTTAVKRLVDYLNDKHQLTKGQLISKCLCCHCLDQKNNEKFLP